MVFDKWRSDWSRSGWLFWQISPTEFTRQITNYSNLRIAESVRGVILLLSFFDCVFTVALVVTTETPDIIGVLRIVSACMMLGLSVLVYNGWPRAALLLIGWFTIDRLIGNILAYETDPTFVAHVWVWVCVGVCAWMLWAHALWIAYSIESVRTHAVQAIKQSDDLLPVAGD